MGAAGLREDVFAARLRLARNDLADAVRSRIPTPPLPRRRWRSIVPVHVGSRAGDEIPVVVRVHTRVFGTLRETLHVPLSGSGSGASVKYSGTLVFPGLRPGEQLTRQVTLAPRADLLASDGTPLAQGPGRTSPIPDVAGQIVGSLGPIPPDDARSYAAKGYPSDAKVGLTGLERVFQDRLAGKPGGTLLAGTRLLARSAPVGGRTVTTTINPTIERAAVTAMAGRYAGIAAMDPRTGGLLALAGVAFSALQPPGSTMKIITATGALEAGIVKLTDTFPVQDSANVGGFILHNANGEFCGGTFLNAFAVSCNSVFAPLGAKLGAARLVNIAERFGFNQSPSIPGAAISEIPSASAIGGDTDVGSSAIGQGMVLSTALEMTDVAATIAMGGRRPLPTLLAHARPRFVHVTSRHVARLVQQMMLAVVAVRNRHRGSDPRRERGRQDRYRGAAQHHQPQRPERGFPPEHRRMVRRLRPGRAPADRGRGAVPRAGRRRRDRSAGRARCARRGAAGALTGSSFWGLLRHAVLGPRFYYAPLA